MRIGSDRSQDEPQIDLVPLIDVILVLIIFFVVTTTFDARSTLQLQLPTASDRNTSAPPRSLSMRSMPMAVISSMTRKCCGRMWIRSIRLSPRLPAMTASRPC